jgi:hypothetical protein
MNFKINWDGLGIVTSIACAIHCAILPLVATSLPLFGVNIIHNGSFEWLMIMIAFVVGGYSLFHGYIKHHRSFLPVSLFTCGFILLLLKQVFHSREVYFLIPAVILIVVAHYYNYRLCTRIKCASLHHQH